MFFIITSMIIAINKKRYHDLIFMTPIVSYWFLLLISIPLNTTRYILPFSMISIFVLIYEIFAKNDNEEQ